MSYGYGLSSGWMMNQYNQKHGPAQYGLTQPMQQTQNVQPMQQTQNRPAPGYGTYGQQNQQMAQQPARFDPGKSRGEGAMSGAASGAAAGTAIMPGWGTAIGAVVGGVGGALTSGQDGAEPRAARDQARMFSTDYRELQRRHGISHGVRATAAMQAANPAAGMASIIPGGQAALYKAQTGKDPSRDEMWQMAMSSFTPPDRMQMEMMEMEQARRRMVVDNLRRSGSALSTIAALAG